jgi:hypothetical protein
MTTAGILTALGWLAVALPFGILVGKCMAYGMGSDDE